MTDIFKSADWAREAELRIVRIDLPPAHSMSGYGYAPIKWLSREEALERWPMSDEQKDGSE